MSYDKKEALVQYGDWDEKSDSHPAMKWMHAYTNKIDENDFDAIWDAGNLVSSDFVYDKADGSSFPPGKASYDAVKATYAFFTSFYHEPYFFTCFELDDNSGWAMTGNAMLHFNLPGDASGSGVTDKQGRKWQMKLPGGFHFIYKKDKSGKDGIKIATTSITSDSGPIVVELLRRGVLSPKDLGL